MVAFCSKARLGWRSDYSRLLPLTGLFLLVVQNMASVTLQHNVQSHPATNTERFEPLTGIVLVEIAKFAISTVYVIYAVSSCPEKEASSQTLLMTHKNAAVPALLYTIATILQSFGAYYLDLVPYLVLSQLKIIMAPLFAQTLLKQRYPARNWIYVAMMALGIVLAQLGTASANPRAKRPLEAQAVVNGVVSMLLAGVCVAMGSVCMERKLKQSGFMFLCSAQLAGYSFVFAFLYLGWLTKLDFTRFFDGFNVRVLVYIALQVSGGFLVAWCVNMTNTVSKNYAQGLGFSLAIALPLMVSQHHINIELFFGVALVLASVLGSTLSSQRKPSAVDIQEEQKVPISDV